MHTPLTVSRIFCTNHIKTLRQVTVNPVSEIPFSDRVKESDKETFIGLFDKALGNKDEGARGTVIFEVGGKEHLIRMNIYYMRSNVSEQIYYTMIDEIDSGEAK